jgi:hypothetical protein
LRKTESMNPSRFLRIAFRCPQEPAPREARWRLLAGLTFGMLFLVASLLWIQAAQADEGLLRGPRKIIRTGAEVADPTSVHQGILENIAAGPVLFYQRFLGSSWGHRCPSYPSCSNYALLAIRKHGAFLGSIITFDRLQHEADEARYTPPVLVGGTIKIYDPLENNDYWWYTPARSEPATPAGVDRDAKP